jgi:hypothetical protein
MTLKCPKCKHELYERLQFCPECGFNFTAALKRCPKCRNNVPRDSKVCPECGLNFEQYSFFVPRLIVFGSLTIIIVSVLIAPWIWKVAPWLHDKGAISSGKLMTEAGQDAKVPLFIKWQSGERYIEISNERSGVGKNSGTDYMNNLVPLPPEVVFHYDMPVGEKVWIIKRQDSSDGNEWVYVGRWVEHGKPGKYGWVHDSNIKVIE